LLSDLIRRLEGLTGANLTGGDRTRGKPERTRGRAAPSTGAAANEVQSNKAGHRASPVSTPPPTARINGTGGSAAPLAETLSHRAAAAAETVPGWTSFIQALMQSHPGLASCLMEGLPSLDEKRRCLLIAFPADKAFQMDRLRQEQAVIEERMAASWGRRLTLELMTTAAEKVGDLPEAVRRRVAPTKAESLAEACRTDQPLSELVDLLQGEVIPEPERQSWLRDDARVEAQAAGDDAASANRADAVSETRRDT
jgi:hypothetical protein